MANKKKIFDRLDNLNIPNSSKNEIFNLIEDVEKDIEKSGETGGEIPEIINKEIYYNDGSNQVVPVKYPDLSTQPSILPYKFMGQYVYEQLIPLAYIAGAWVIENEKANAIMSVPLSEASILDATMIGLYHKKLVPLMLRNINLAFDSGFCGFIEASHPSVHGTSLTNTDYEVMYARIVYTSMPEEGEDYYYNNDSRITNGIILGLPTSAPPTTDCYIYNGEKYIYSVVVTEGLYFNIPSDYNADTMTSIIIRFEDSSYKLKKAVYSNPYGERGELSVEDYGIHVKDIIDKAKDRLITITASE